MDVIGRASPRLCVRLLMILIYRCCQVDDMVADAEPDGNNWINYQVP